MTASPRDLRAAGTCDRAQEGLENEDGYYCAALAMMIVALSYFWPVLVRALDQTKFEFLAPDPDPQYVKPPVPGQSYGCDPLADSNVFDDRFTHKATIWGRPVSVEGCYPGERYTMTGNGYCFMRATDVSWRYRSKEFKITLNNSSYMMAEEAAHLGRCTD